MYWAAYAVAAAMVWGLHYNFLGKALTVVSPVLVLFFSNALFMLLVPFWGNQFAQDITNVARSSTEVRASVFALMATGLTATWLTYRSIQLGSPALASLLEISYPIFVVLFGILFFKTGHLNWPTLIGSSLVIIGSATIIRYG